MSDTKKPREFWLADVFTKDHGEVLVAFQQHKNIKGSIHVIEKSAYDKLERAWEVESEAHTFYKREWESACERYDSLKADYDELKSGAAKLVEALNEILAYAQDSDQRRETARLALAEYEGKE